MSRKSRSLAGWPAFLDARRSEKSMDFAESWPLGFAFVRNYRVISTIPRLNEQQRVLLQIRDAGCAIQVFSNHSALVPRRKSRRRVQDARDHSALSTTSLGLEFRCNHCFRGGEVRWRGSMNYIVMKERFPDKLCAHRNGLTLC